MLVVKNDFESMAKTCICDLCSRICDDGNYMTLTGWWGKYEFSKNPKSGESRYDTKIVSKVPPIEIDICQFCIERKLASLISFQPQISIWEKRDRDYEEWKKTYPDKAFKGLLKTYPGGIQSIICDLCGSDCFDKYVNLKSSTKNPDRTAQGADICEQCYENQLKSLIGIMGAKLSQSAK